MRQEVQKAIWDREQVARMEDGDNNNRRRLEKIFNKIRKVARDEPAKVNVLNIGIGNGMLEGMLMGAGFQTYSLDPSKNAVQAISTKLGAPAGRCRVGSCADLPFDPASMDFIVMSEVIEHLEDATLASCMGELRRALKPGGYFIGTCPDHEDVKSKTHTCPACGERFHRVGHVRSFTQDSLRRYLAAHFDVEQCYSFRGMALNWKGLAMYHYQSLPYRLFKLIKPSISIPQSMGQHLFFLARKSA